jgi:uncharacterized protein YndB with AHSA1/START domain
MAEKTNALRVTTPSDREIVLTRVFDAPRRLVFAAYTDPKHIPHWWGPKRFTTTVDRMDVRPGGAWRFVQRDGDGNEFGFHGEYREIVPPARLVDTFEFEGMPGHVAVQTAIFKERNGKTELTVTLLFDTVEDRDGMLKSGMEKGSAETMNRLDEYLPRMRDDEKESADRELVLTRVLNAPRALVFKVWTDPKHLAQWWGPHGFTNPVCEWDPRPGGAILVHMRGPDGTVYPMTGVYREVVEPERLVFTSAALDKEGNPLFEVLNTVTFAEHAGRTTLTLQARVVKTTAAAAPHLAGMEVGWSQSLERLEAHVAKASSEKQDGATGAADREIVTTRVFDAPRELVFKTWTDPKHVAQWWGPNGFTNTIHEMDVRPGGHWRFIMHGPDGVDYRNEIVFIEIVTPERLVYSHVSGPKFRMTVTFEEQGGKTKLTMRMLFETAAEHDQAVKVFGAIEGAKQTLKRLDEYLAKM